VRIVHPIMHKLFIAMLLVHHLTALGQTLPPFKGSTQKLQQFQHCLDSIFNQHPETKGIAIYLVSNNKQLLWYSAVGKANSSGEALSVNHPVNIASVTKTYVAAAILRLVEQHKFTLETPIALLLSAETNTLLSQSGYATNHITVKHLLSNTSGIYDFVNAAAFQHKTTQQPTYIWTRQEQIALAMQAGEKRFNPGEQFEYSETNYLLLAEILEKVGKAPFHEVLKRELKFDELNLKQTWFLHQEQKPKKLLPMAEQTAKAFGVNSLVLHPSFDAFGGGGLGSTVADMCNFGTYLFEGKIIENPLVLAQMTTPILTNGGKETGYCLGLVHSSIQGLTAYGHGGFWGTHLKYIHALKLSIGVYVLERDAWPIYNQLIDELVKEMNKP